MNGTDQDERKNEALTKLDQIQVFGQAKHVYSGSMAIYYFVADNN